MLHQLDVSPQVPLLWTLSKKLNLTGAKYGCGHAMCGACTVDINCQAARSCSIMVGEAEGKAVTIIEGVSGKVAEAVIETWQRLDDVQCGYCQSGQIISGIALLSENPTPTDADIDADMEDNTCRCGTYVRIRRAIDEAARTLA